MVETAARATLPDTIIGVLGSTGVGKSSLLNALLGEASILPTSGSRGCTAAVVELFYNKDLLSASQQAGAEEQQKKKNKVGMEELEEEEQGPSLIDELEGEERNEENGEFVPVYVGEVEFIRKDEWFDELDTLLDEW